MNLIQPQIISGIYKIINKINGKYYVGSSKNIRRRWELEHVPSLINNKHHCHLLQTDWNKDGIGNFEFKIIEEVPYEKLMEIEQKYLDIAYKEKNNCYNILFESERFSVGRNKKYFTKEEKLTARKERQMRYYWKNVKEKRKKSLERYYAKKSND